MTKNFVASFLRSFVDELKAEEPYIYGDHTNLWIEYGWDISKGDGEISAMVEERVALLVDSLPPIVQEYLWWNSVSGRLVGRKIEDAVEQNIDELNSLTRPTQEEFTEDITEVLVSWLRDSSEKDYDRFSESDYMDEDEDLEEDEEDWEVGDDE